MKGYEEESASRKQLQQAEQTEQTEYEHDNNGTEEVVKETQEEQQQSEEEEEEEEEANKQDAGGDTEQLGIRSDVSTLAQLMASRDAFLAEIVEKEDELEVEIGPIPKVGGYIPIRTCTYTPLLVRYVVSSFSHWYLASGEFLSPSGLSGMWGMHFSAVGNPSYYAVERLRAAVRATLTAIALPTPSTSSSAHKEESHSIGGGSEASDTITSSSTSSTVGANATAGASAGAGIGTGEGAGASASARQSASAAGTAKCLILFEGQVIWNDFFDHDIMHMYEFIRLQQNNSIREAAEFIQSVSSVSANFPPDEVYVSASSSNTHKTTNRSSLPNIGPTAGAGVNAGEEKTNAMQKLQTFSR